MITRCHLKQGETVVGWRRFGGRGCLGLTSPFEGIVSMTRVWWLGACITCDLRMLFCRLKCPASFGCKALMFVLCVMC